MKKNLFKYIAFIMLIMSLPVKGYAQLSDNKEIRLYAGVAPGSETWNWEEKNFGPFLSNVTIPTLTVFEADKSIATGTAVVVCPGGAFHFLSMKNEGYDIAKWLNDKGITAFVLKYRLGHLSTDNPLNEMREMQKDFSKFTKDIEPIISMAVIDAKTAIAYIRNHASEWGIDNVGIMGFSAGGTITTGLAFSYEAKERPDFVAPIYPYAGGFINMEVPVDAPPMFIAGASNDEYKFHKDCISLYEKWVDADKSAELHLFKSGGHGFGIIKKDIPTDNWINLFYDWYMDLMKK